MLSMRLVTARVAGDLRIGREVFERMIRFSLNPLAYTHALNRC